MSKGSQQQYEAHANRQSEMLKWADAQGAHAEGAARMHQEAVETASENSHILNRKKRIGEAATAASSQVAMRGVEHDMVPWEEPHLSAAKTEVIGDGSLMKVTGVGGQTQVLRSPARNG